MFAGNSVCATSFHRNLALPLSRRKKPEIKVKAGYVKCVEVWKCENTRLPTFWTLQTRVFQLCKHVFRYMMAMQCYYLHLNLIIIKNQLKKKMIRGEKYLISLPRLDKIIEVSCTETPQEHHNTYLTLLHSRPSTHLGCCLSNIPLVHDSPSFL